MLQFMREICNILQFCLQLDLGQAPCILTNTFKTAQYIILGTIGDSKEKMRSPCVVHEDNIISDDKDVSETLNSFFQKAVDTLEIKENNYLLTDTDNESDPLDSIIKKFKNHPSILTIKNNIKTEIFTFNEVNLSDIEREISNLKSQKSGTSGNIPTKILTKSSEICSKTLLNI